MKPFRRPGVVGVGSPGLFMADADTLPSIAEHGATRLPSVVVDSYNIELKDDEGFIGDRASKGAFRELLEKWRKPARKSGDDPFGDTPSEDIPRKTLDSLLTKGDSDAAGIVQSAIEDFSQNLAQVIRRYVKTKAWQDTEKIVIGGGFRSTRVGELVVGRTTALLKADKLSIDLEPIRNDPDEAGLIGCAHLGPAWMFRAHDAILAVDIGGTNIRAGVVELNLKKSNTLSKAGVWKFELWRHADEEKISREKAVQRLVDMLEGLIGKAKKADIKLAPFIGIGCPGLITKDGSIERGAQNLPGNWESSKFHLPGAIHEAIPKIGDDETAIVMHNDAVVQGLSECPFMMDVKRWGVLTIGTGLGNARFTNRKDE
jgi:predicted NBD/HSP70 family sugar kinase